MKRKEIVICTRAKISTVSVVISSGSASTTPIDISVSVNTPPPSEQDVHMQNPIPLAIPSELWDAYNNSILQGMCSDLTWKLEEDELAKQVGCNLHMSTESLCTSHLSSSLASTLL